MIVVARAKGGCALNGREYLLDYNDNVKTFKSKSVAKAYLWRMGLGEEEITSLEYLEYKSEAEYMLCEKSYIDYTLTSPDMDCRMCELIHNMCSWDGKKIDCPIYEKWLRRKVMQNDGEK